ncbi:MAG: MFS transporter [Nitrososphaerota archaeon]|nr:MFS transporter [Nitrososphaerota archaeon]MDG7043441.1 MFS transporter [Nitrososphaerota archaeon]
MTMSQMCPKKLKLNLNLSRYYAPVLIGMGGFTDGFALLIASGALLTLVPYFRLTSSYTGLIVSAPFIGAIIGALSFGRLADITGRRVIFLNVLLFFVLGSLLSAIATVPSILLLSRFLVGIGIGGDIPVGGSLISEISNRENRGRLIAVQSLLWGVGGVAAATIAVLFLPLGAESWRYILGMGAVPPLIVLLLRRGLPESKVWSASKGVDLKARPIDKQKFATKLSFVAIAFFIWTFILAIFASYTPSFLSQAEGLSKVWALLVSGLQWMGFVGGTALTFKYVDKIGRRVMIISSSIIVGVFLIVGYLLARSSVALFISNISIIWVLGGVGYTISSIYSNELFPTLFRSTSSGIGFASGRLGGYLSTLVFPTLLISFGISPLFLMLAPLPIAVGLAGVSMAPRSERKNLDELESEVIAANGDSPREK